MAEQYNVSRNTIKRDAKVSESIDAIGGESPYAKRKILSGEIKLDKKELEELSFKTREEISDLAARIEDGTYEKAKQKAPAGVPPLETEIIKIAESFYSGLRKLSSGSDAARIQAVLRAHIDKLEELYQQLSATLKS